MKSKILVVANWKMNPGTYDEAETLSKESELLAKKNKNLAVVLCLPYTWLTDLSHKGSKVVSFGAQDSAVADKGAYTGEISAKMLYHSRVKHVILGHSERRALGETEALIAQKVQVAVKAGLKVILCVGEKERDAHGEFLTFLRQQIVNSLAKLPKKYLSKLILAYEPVWAIGQAEKDSMKPSDIHEASLFIRKVLIDLYGKDGFTVPILYGGAVGPDNASQIILTGEVQGLLVGHVSLNPKKFGDLLASIN